MKEALIIFMILLILLTIISVFGGSIRFTPIQADLSGSSWFAATQQQQPSWPMALQQQPQQQQQPYHMSDPNAWRGGSAQWLAERFQDDDDDDKKRPSVAAEPTDASPIAEAPVDPAGDGGGVVEPFHGASELASF